MGQGGDEKSFGRIEDKDARKDIRVDQFMLSMGIEHRSSGSQISVKVCPFCHPDTSDPANQWKLYVKQGDGVYYCHRCHAKGSWASYLKTLEQARKDERIVSVWAETVSSSDERGGPLRDYLKNRGLDGAAFVESLRLHLEYPYYDPASRRRLGHFPTVVGRITDPGGTMIGIQRIFLTRDGLKADVPEPKKCLGSIKGGAVHLGTPTTTLGVAEGIETGLAVMLATKMPIWAAVSATGMESLLVPDQVKHVFVWADLDRGGAGLRAAERLAHRMREDRRVVCILLPAGPIPDGEKSLDWLDVYNADPGLLVAALKKARPYAGATAKEEPPNPLVENASWPQPIADEAYYGLAGEIVKAIEPHTEADPVALLIQLLVAFGNVVGRNAHYLVESTPHHLNLFTVLVGETAKGRKGTSLDHVVALMKGVVPDWASNNIISGLSTGEGLIHHVRDPLEKQKTIKNKDTGEPETVKDVKDDGVADKRLLVIEPEYSSVLRITSRDGNTLSATVREAWDRGDLRTLTKNSPERATGAHISIVGHITAHELRRCLTETETLNGFGNRFLWVCVRRSKLLPFGGQLKRSELDAKCARLERAINFGMGLGEIKLADSTRQVWVEVYYKLSEAKPGLYGSMTARAEAQVIRLAAVYAVLDESSSISPQHLMAGLALWEYCEDSCRFIFGSSLGDLVADRILDALRAKPEGMTRTDIRELFSGKQTAGRIEQALALLVQYGLARTQKESTSGRPIEWWMATKRARGGAERAVRVESPPVDESSGALAPLKPLKRPAGSGLGDEIDG